MGVKIDQAAVWLDDSLGDTDVMTGKVATCSATITAEVLLGDGGSATFRARGRAKLDLPRMKRRLNMFVDNYRYDVLPNADSLDNGEEVNVGTHWNLSKTFRSMFDFDIGVKIRGSPEVFTRLEFVFKHQLGDWAFRLNQKGFWTVTDRFGELTVVTFAYPLSQQCRFFSLTAAKWSEKSDGLESEQGFGIVQEFAGRRQLDLSANVFARQKDIVNYRLSVGWRSKWLRPWNSIYLIPDLQFPEEEGFRAHPGLKVGFETVY
jgi:hypothetical protein